MQLEGLCGGSEGTCGQVVIKWLDGAADGTVQKREKRDRLIAQGPGQNF